jgi:hypothetical protein
LRKARAEEQGKQAELEDESFEFDQEFVIESRVRELSIRELAANWSLEIGYWLIAVPGNEFLFFTIHQ